MIVYFEKWTRRYWPTQADAKDAAREARVCGGEKAGFEQVEVPTSEGRDRLCEFLNNLEDAARNAAEPERPVPHHPLETPPLDVGRFTRQRTTDEIIDFILDEATPAQAGRILEALGGRIGSWSQERKG